MDKLARKNILMICWGRKGREKVCLQEDRKIIERRLRNKRRRKTTKKVFPTTMRRAMLAARQ